MLKYEQKFPNWLESVKWGQRKVSIQSTDGKVLLDKTIIAPDTWSQTACNIVAGRYLAKEDENHIGNMIERVVNTIAHWGLEDKYFSAEDGIDFENDLSWLIVNQVFSFNSPVWFNVGIQDKPQCSACFINSVEDSMDSILNLGVVEGTLFKHGSGTGSNLSTLRSSKEFLSNGGIPSGPVSFMRSLDASAGAIKSGGKTRRAARINLLNVDHPDIIDFINVKAIEEKKAWALIDAGYDGGFNVEGGAYDSVSMQNTNISVSACDDFMSACVDGGKWQTRAVTTGEVVDTYDADDILTQIAESAWLCGDPGIAFSDTINENFPCGATARINSSNPCQPGFATVLVPGGVRSFDDISVGSTIWTGKCWTKVVRKVMTGIRPVNRYILSNGLCFIGTENHNIFQDGEKIQVGKAERIDISISLKEELHSTVSREIVKVEYMGEHPVFSITVSDPEHRYWTGGCIAANCGEFLFVDNSACNLGSINLMKFNENARSIVRIAVIAMDIIIDRASYPTKEIEDNSKHYRPIGLGFANLGGLLMSKGVPYDSVKGRELAANLTEVINSLAYETSRELAEHLGSPWYDENIESAKVNYHHRIRNAQTTLIAPTGTIGFMMDCDTTGPEPEYALVKLKMLVGGGSIQSVNGSVIPGLHALGYSQEEIEKAHKHLLETGTLKGVIKEEHLPVFDCANQISPMGHLKMLEAVQPYLSGGISKTINVPTETTVQQIKDIYIQAWKMGLKSVTVYRDGSKRSQPLNDTFKKKEPTKEILTGRKRLPDERPSFTHKFDIAGHEGYLTVGLYPDGRPGELFITMSKQGSMVSGLMDAFATQTSMSLQYGVPLEKMIEKFRYTKFEPAGFTRNESIRTASSILDYIFHWMELKFTDQEETIETEEAPTSDSPPCLECGSVMVRNGACYKCTVCGGTSGCS